MTPGYREFVTQTGYTIQYRTLPPDFLDALRGRVRREHEPTRPAPLTRRVETAPGVFAEHPVALDGETHGDEDLARQIAEARAALAAWETEVTRAITRAIQDALLKTVKFPMDAEAVAATRDLYAMTDKPLSDLSDEFVMLWYVILPDVTDQAATVQSLAGISVQEAVERARVQFRRTLEG